MKEMLAQALREHPTWGDAYIAEKQRADAACRLLLEIEGALLGYWTDLPESAIRDFLPRIRDLLGAWPQQERAQR